MDPMDPIFLIFSVANATRLLGKLAYKFLNLILFVFFGADETPLCMLNYLFGGIVEQQDIILLFYIVSYRVK